MESYDKRKFILTLHLHLSMFDWYSFMLDCRFLILYGFALPENRLSCHKNGLSFFHKIIQIPDAFQTPVFMVSKNYYGTDDMHSQPKRWRWENNNGH
jgi:hypothetical protein